MGESTGQPYIGSSIEAHVGLGIAHMEDRNYHRAIEDFSAARALAPGMEPVLLLGKTYFLSGERKEAMEIFEGLYGSAGPREKCEAALWIAAVYDSISDPEEGLRWAEMIGKGIPAGERLRSHFLYRLGRRGEAIEAGRRAAQRIPRDPAACRILALALLDDVWSGPGPHRGRKVLEAFCASRKALDLDPGSAFARSLVSTAGAEFSHEMLNYLRRKCMNAHTVVRALVAVALALAAPRPGEGQEGFFDGVRKVEEVSTPGILEWGAELSTDGLELFYEVFETDRSRYQLRVATREEKGEPWASVKPIDELNGPLAGTSLTGRCEPSISSSGRDLYFGVINEGTSLGALWMATRSDRSEPFADPRALDEVNHHEIMRGMSFITAPEISADDLELFFCAETARGSGHFNMYVATREEAGQPFTEVRALSDINLPTVDEFCPDLSSDRLTVFWSDFDPPYRPGGLGTADIWMASRPDPDKPFGAVKNVGFPVNTSIFEASPCISADWPAHGSELYFARITDDGSTADIYVATWHLDCNGNHVDDAEEIATSDCNDNGVIDSCDIASGTSADVNSNGIPDSCEPDCDGGGVPDAYEIAQGTAKDCNSNGIPDSCDIAAGTSKDEDPEDGIPDDCPPAGGLQRPGDMNQDGTLDISDAVSLLGHLFLGTTPALPCDGGAASSPGIGALKLIDFNGDKKIDLSDPISILGFLFLGSKPPALGTDCVRIVDCPEKCR